MLKRFFRYFEKYKKYIIGSIAFVVLETGFELVIPMIMADIIDVGVVNRDTNYILMKSVAMVACCSALLLFLCVARLRLQ
jgi:ATP-binding cassette subfamily B protein